MFLLKHTWGTKFQADIANINLSKRKQCFSGNFKMIIISLFTLAFCYNVDIKMPFVRLKYLLILIENIGLGKIIIFNVKAIFWK